MFRNPDDCLVFIFVSFESFCFVYTFCGEEDPVPFFNDAENMKRLAFKTMHICVALVIHMQWV